MKPGLILPLIALVAVIAAATPAANVETKWVPLFDGKTFAGWEGDLSKFRIEDEAIVGGNLTNSLKHNYFMATTKRYDHFELRLEVKLTGENANAGIQLRTERIPGETEVIGYQADMGQKYWGCLYDESRRKRILQQPDPALLKKILKPNDWNDYRIRCEGKHIQLWLNGTKTVDYVEAAAGIPQMGIIALQIHSGKPAEAWYRNIRIKVLAAEGVGKNVTAN